MASLMSFVTTVNHAKRNSERNYKTDNTRILKDWFTNLRTSARVNAPTLNYGDLVKAYKDIVPLSNVGIAMYNVID